MRSGKSKIFKNVQDLRFSKTLKTSQDFQNVPNVSNSFISQAPIYSDFQDLRFSKTSKISKCTHTIYLKLPSTAKWHNLNRGRRQSSDINSVSYVDVCFRSLTPLHSRWVHRLHILFIKTYTPILLHMLTYAFEVSRLCTRDECIGCICSVLRHILLFRIVFWRMLS